MVTREFENTGDINRPTYDSR